MSILRVIIGRTIISRTLYPNRKVYIANIYNVMIPSAEIEITIHEDSKTRAKRPLLNKVYTDNFNIEHRICISYSQFKFRVFGLYTPCANMALWAHSQVSRPFYKHSVDCIV